MKKSIIFILFSAVFFVSCEKLVKNALLRDNPFDIELNATEIKGSGASCSAGLEFDILTLYFDLYLIEEDMIKEMSFNWSIYKDLKTGDILCDHSKSDLACLRYGKFPLPILYPSEIDPLDYSGTVWVKEYQKEKDLILLEFKNFRFDNNVLNGIVPFEIQGGGIPTYKELREEGII